MTSLAIGQRCIASDAPGVIRFIGTTEFSAGLWIGIELDEAQGKNDGTVQGVRYFDCAEKRGVFVRESKVVTTESVDRSYDNDPTETRRSAGTHGFKAPMPRIETPRTPSHLSRPVSRISTPSVAATHVSRKVDNLMLTPQRRQSARHGMSNSGKAISSPRRSLSPAKSSTNAPLLLPSSVRQISSSSKATRHVGDSISPGHSASAQTPNSSQSKSTNSLRPTIHADLRTNEEKVDPPQPSDTSPVAIEQLEPVQSINNRDLENLRSKLKSLEVQRLDDMRRLSILGALESEKAAWVTIRTKLREKLQAQQSEIKDLKEKMQILEQTLRESQAEIRGTESSGQGDATEMLEMATLDREMAEEERDQLKIQLAFLQHKTEELTLELEIRREEEQLEESSRSASDIRVLSVQNERLREALIRLKEITEEQDRTIADSVRESESKDAELQIIKSQVKLLSGQLKDMEALVEDFKAQVDISIGAEEMLEALTHRNLVLGEQVEKYKAEIADLESLKEISDEMEENHIQAQKELTDEFSLQAAVVREQSAWIVDAEDILAEHTNTIEKFRNLVRSLQLEVDELRMSGATSQALTAEFSQQARDLLAQNTSLRSNERKGALRLFDNELRQIEASSALEHLGILQEYLPETYESDRSSVDAYLAAKWISSTCMLMYETMRQQLRSINTPEDTILVAGISRSLTLISSKMSRFAVALKYSSPEDFLQYKGLAFDIVSLSKTIRNQVRSIQQDTLNESEMIESLGRSLIVVQHMEERFEPSAASAEFYNSQVRILQSIMDLINVLITFASSSSDRLPEETIFLGSDLASLRQSLHLATISTGKLSPILSEHEVSEGLIVSICDTVREVYLVFDATENCVSQLQPSSDQLASKPEFRLENLDLALQRFCQGIDIVLAERSDESNFDQKKPPRIPPWQLRGQVLKDLKNVDEETQDRLNRAQLDLQEIVIQLHHKSEALEEEQLKSQALVRRVHEQARASEAAKLLESVEQKSLADKKSYEETLEELREQIESLQEQLRFSRPISDGKTSMTELENASQHELDVLRSTVRYLNRELATLKLSASSKDLAFLSKPLPLVRPKKDTSNIKLHKALREFIAGMHFVDFAKTAPAQKKWTAQRDKCGFSHFVQEERFAQLLSMKREIMEH